MEKIRQAGPVAALVLAVLIAGQAGRPLAAPIGSGSSGAGQIPAAEVFQDSDFKAVWVPYMSLDMTAESSRHFGTFKARFDRLLAQIKSVGANTIIVHVRPFGDAMYRSAYFPWSHLLTGTQGQDPGYDPLAYMVEAAHREGLAIHAWINPLRIRSASTPGTLGAGNVHRLWRNDGDSANDSWTVETDTGIYLNPGWPGVRTYIQESVAELVSNYNVDGVHMDDYFYPTRDESFDRAAYDAYRAGLSDGEEALTLDEWRTDAVNQLVAGLYRTVKDCRSDLQFGISPAGNVENCRRMYADVETWGADAGYVDYLCPQLYYPNEGGTVDFADSARQWAELVTAPEVALYGGLALYKAGDAAADNGAWAGRDDILRQQLTELAARPYRGFALYSAQYLDTAQTAAALEQVKECLGAAG